MLQIANTHDDAMSSLKLIVYGPAGIGKTTFGATFPRPLILDCEGGLLALRGRDQQYIRCRSVSDVLEAINLIRANIGSYDTVVVDSLTEIVRMVVDDVRPWTGTQQPPMTLRDWGASIEASRRLVRAFRDLPGHTVFTALPREVRGANGEIVSVRPSLPGRLADEVCAAVDFVLYLGVRTSGDTNGRLPARVLLTGASGRFFAKDRSGKLPPWIDPTWEALSTALAGSAVGRDTQTVAVAA